MSEKLTLKPSEAAHLLGVSLPSVYELCRRNDFPAFHVGRCILISADGLRRWVSQQAGEGGEK